MTRPRLGFVGLGVMGLPMARHLAARHDGRPRARPPLRPRPRCRLAALNASTGIAQPILTRRFDEPFKLALVAKDIDIALRIATDAGLEMPLARANQALWHDRYFTDICRNP